MKRRRLGRSDLHISKLGFGAWAIGGNGWEWGWGAQGDAQSVRALHRAFELGINWVDTAPAYGMGHSEEVVGRALREWPGERPLVFTKCGLKWNEAGQLDRDLSPERLRQECDDSLRRLGVETIDLYQIHWPTDDPMEAELAWRVVNDLRREGKVRHVGVSNFDTGLLRRIDAHAAVTSLQPPYSLINRAIESAILPYCQHHDIGVLVYSPMASGLLSGQMTRDRIAALPADDWRKQSEDFREPKLGEHLKRVDRLAAAGAERGVPAGSMALAWTLRNPAVTGAIVGIRRPDQIEDLATASDLECSPAEWAEIAGV